MPFLIDIPYLKKFIPEGVENEDIYLLRLYISASAKVENVKVPKDIAVEFDVNDPNLGKLVCIEPVYFFTRATSLFIDRKKVEFALKSIKAKVSIIGINLYAIKRSIEDNKLGNESPFDLYREIMSEYNLRENAFPEDVYTELGNAMLYLSLSNSRIIYGNKYPDNSSGCIRLAKLLKNKLHLSYSQQIAFIYRVNEQFNKTKPINKKYTPEQIKAIRKEIWPMLGFFPNYEDSHNYVKKVDESITLVYAISHFLSALQILEIYNRSSSNEKIKGEKRKKTKEEESLEYYGAESKKDVKIYDPEELVFASNNIAIECDIVLDSVKAVLLCNSVENRRVVFVEPSFTLIDRWYRDNELETIPALFVINNREVCSILNYHNIRKGKSKKDFVHFISFDDYIASTACEAGEIILCTNISKLTQQQCGEISYRKKLHSDSVIFAVDFDKSFSSSSLVLMEREYISRVMIFPVGMEGEKGCKRSLWLSENIRKENIDVEFLARKSAKEKNVIKRVGKEIFDRDLFFPSFGKALRGHLLNLVNDKRTNHNSKCSFMFSPSIRLYLSGFSDIPLFCGESSIKTYIRAQFRIKSGDVYKFVPVPDSRISRRFSSLDEAKKFLNEEYPFALKRVEAKKIEVEESDEIEKDTDIPDFKDLSFTKVKNPPTVDKKKERYVGSIVREMMDDKKYRVRYPSLFKEFVFLFYDELQKSMCEKDLKILKTLFYDSDFSLKPLREITPDFLTEYLSEDVYDDVSFSHAFNAMKIACDIAVDFCLLQRNEFALIKNDEKEWNKIASRTRRALTKKDFTREEFTKLYRYLIYVVEDTYTQSSGKTEKEFGEYKAKALCMLISLLTGLEANIVPAIKWRDVEFISDDVCVVKIVRQFTNNGVSVNGIEDDYDHRPLPLGRILTKLMVKAMKRLKKLAGTDDEKLLSIKEKYIANAFNAEVDSMEKRIAPRDITGFENYTIASVLKIEERLIHIPSFGGGTKENDISKYCGDILRENFRRYASTVGGFSDDEIAYFFGNKPVTTLGMSYRDFRYVGSLLELNVKLNRISAMLEGNGVMCNPTDDSSSAYIKSENPTSLDLFITAESPLKLSVSVNHGFLDYVKEENYAD